MPLDPAVLDHQLALLDPVAVGLRSEAWHRRPIEADAWRGPSAEKARELEEAMLARLREAAAAAEDAVRRILTARSALP